MSLVLKILGTILNVIAIIVNSIANLLVPRLKPSYPPIKNPLLKKPVVELREDLRQKKVKSFKFIKKEISIKICFQHPLANF